MNQEEFNKLLLKYETGHCSEKEHQIVELWFRNLQSPKAVAHPEETKAQIFRNINTGLEKEGEFWQWSVGLAALLLLALGIVFYFVTGSTGILHPVIESPVADKVTEPIINKTSSPQTVTLSDGSIITLEPESKLTVISFTEAVRRVHLTGKAFFKVDRQPQRPFHVITENLVTTVLGTTFTINTLGSEGEIVEVKTGRVAVFLKSKTHKKDSDSVTITPNLQAAYNKVRRELKSSVVKHPRMLMPEFPEGHRESPAKRETSGFVMRYEETPVSKILEALEAGYGLKIIFDKTKLSTCLLTVNLQEEDLFLRLQAICRAIGGSYQVKGTQVIVRSKGC